MAFLAAATPETLSDLQGHSPYSCAAVDETLTNVQRRAVPLRQLSFLLNLLRDEIVRS